ncbi:MAG: hypothetical protein BGO41_08325 [Clostridiales bacterium 38-18]|nr:MAG: hypothetical protein BGO41_08325 [Clostridiales bacterium 38-18]
MSLLEQWNAILEGKGLTQAQSEEFWNAYLAHEKGIYEDILSQKVENGVDTITGTVKSFGEKYELEPMLAIGFIDGIHTSLKEEPSLEEMTEESELNFTIDFEKLFLNMHKAKATWLHQIPLWNDILTKEQMKAIKAEYVSSVTVRVENKVGRNDPCPCGSGKKYKKCCIDKE